ncbi:MAG: histidine phosphatase family protein [Pseudomonadota bacterium]
MLKLFKSRALPGGQIRLAGPVYFVRHGQTDWNAARKFQGHADIPLNDTGRHQAARNGLALREALGRAAPLFCVASPLSRATETLEIIRKTLDLPARRYMLDDRLIEIDLGAWNGKTPDEINTETPGAFEARDTDKWSFEVPGGESYAAASGRTRAFLEELRAEKRSAPLLIVGHGAAGRILRGYLSNRTRDAVPHLKAPQHKVFKLWRGRETAL